MAAELARRRLRAPFPWFGGKSRVADLVWERFGNVTNYVEPFAGSLAVLLGRPHEARVETVNDRDAFLANFWRALQREPDHVAWWADYPVSEADLHARHRWLVEETRDRTERIRTDPEYYDCQIAGWWVWGLCLWIGSGWCLRPTWQQIPNIGNGRRHRMFLGGGLGGGSGVHARRLVQRRVPTRLHQKLPALVQGGNGRSGYGLGVLSEMVAEVGLYRYFEILSARLRNVRVTCGDWSRVLSRSLTTYMGTTAVFLDPPYALTERDVLYREDADLTPAVVAWAREHGDDPEFRIALCGYEGTVFMPSTWACVPWKAHGGYSRSAKSKKNRGRERIWFSPHCVHPESRLRFEA